MKITAGLMDHTKTIFLFYNFSLIRLRAKSFQIPEDVRNTAILVNTGRLHVERLQNYTRHTINSTDKKVNGQNFPFPPNCPPRQFLK